MFQTTRCWWPNCCTSSPTARWLRSRSPRELVGVENQVWLQVEGFDKVYAIANEDLDRSTDEKTSAVHFMRFEFTPR